jgi:hypothetical protein
MVILKVKGKIKSMKCIGSPKTLRSCDHLWIGTLFGLHFVPYYCDEKQKEIINPDGKRKCKQFK